MAKLILTPDEKKAVAIRSGHTAVALHNFIVDFLRAQKKPEDAFVTLLAAATAELVQAVGAIYPQGPNQLRSDVIALGSLAEIDVHTVEVDAHSKVIH